MGRGAEGDSRGRDARRLRRSVSKVFAKLFQFRPFFSLFSASFSKHSVGGFERFQGVASPPSPISFSPNFSPLGVAGIGVALCVRLFAANLGRALPRLRVRRSPRLWAEPVGRVSEGLDGLWLPAASGI